MYLWFTDSTDADTDAMVLALRGTRDRRTDAGLLRDERYADQRRIVRYEDWR